MPEMLGNASILQDRENSQHLLRKCNDITNSLIAAGHGQFLLQALKAASSSTKQDNKGHILQNHLLEQTITTNATALSNRSSHVSALGPEQLDLTPDNVDGGPPRGPIATTVINLESLVALGVSITTPSSTVPDRRPASPEGRGASETSPSSPATGKRRSQSLYRPSRPPPALRVLQKCFWTLSIQDLPVYDCSPFEYYILFVTLKAGHDMDRTLALCNNGTEIQVIRTLPNADNNRSEYDILKIQHPNFIDLYRLYIFEGKVFDVIEYMAFSLKEMLHNSIFSTELEIAYIISQVSLICI
jgi:hypothetical protein